MAKPIIAMHEQMNTASFIKGWFVLISINLVMLLYNSFWMPLN